MCIIIVGLCNVCQCECDGHFKLSHQQSNIVLRFLSRCIYILYISTVFCLFFTCRHFSKPSLAVVHSVLRFMRRCESSHWWPQCFSPAASSLSITSCHNSWILQTNNVTQCWVHVTLNYWENVYSVIYVLLFLPCVRFISALNTKLEPAADVRRIKTGNNLSESVRKQNKIHLPTSEGMKCCDRPGDCVLVYFFATWQPLASYLTHRHAGVSLLI